MKIPCISSNRTLILQVLERELDRQAVYCGLPVFSYTVGGITLCRDGRIEFDAEDASALHAAEVLSSLGLCAGNLPECSAPPPPLPDLLRFSTEGHSGLSLFHLLCLLSARQYQLNQALDARGAFFVSSPLVSSLLAHPPETIPEFLQMLYGREREYTGVSFSLSQIHFPGFLKGHAQEHLLHRQLAELLLKASLQRQWTCAYPRNVRNRKYAFRTWLNAIGMIGPEYEQARTLWLSRLYGRSDRKAIQ